MTEDGKTQGIGLGSCPRLGSSKSGQTCPFCWGLGRGHSGHFQPYPFSDFGLELISHNDLGFLETVTAWGDSQEDPIF